VNPRTAKLRIHVQESKNSLPVFRVTEQRLAPLIAGTPGLKDRIEVSYANDRAGLDAGLTDAEVLLVGNFESENLRNRAPRLAWVQSIFAGVEKLIGEVPADIVLTNARGVHAPKAGEYGMSALLMLNSRVPRFEALRRERKWEPVFTPVVSGKTVVILGTGNLGAAVAGHARHFGMRVIGINRQGRAAQAFDAVHPVADLQTAVRNADFLVVTLPNAPHTRKLVDAQVFAAMPKGAGVVSIGRGQVVDEAALIAALQSGHLGGAVLDVFQEEPLPPQSPLWSLDNVIVSAHCAVDDLEAYLPRAMQVFLRNLVRYLDKQPLENLVDRRLGY
jgi:phosphoglycerate dehydrogenase-like enzyme